MEIKRLIVLIILITASISASSYASSLSKEIEAVNSITIKVNGKSIDSDNVLIDGSTYVPLRKIAEMLQKIVSWDGVAKTASIDDQTSDKNPYTESMLKDLVKRTPCNKSILEFRETQNERRNGLLKIEGKFFDMYYPIDEYAEEVALFLEPHMDKVYAMMMDLYGLQGKVEVHLIHAEDAIALREGDIRAEESVTMIFLEPSNDQGGNNLSEFVHEINHNFFQEANNGATNIMWINEAHAKLIPSLYIKHNYNGKVDMWSFDEMNNIANGLEEAFRAGYKMTLKKADDILKQQRSWARAEGDKRTAQIFGLYYWMYVYNSSNLDEFKYYIRNLGSENVLPKIEELFGKSHEVINDSILDDIKVRSEKYWYENE